MAKGKFATAVNCMDGRTQEPMIKWFKENYGVDYIDAVTEPGPLKHLAEGNAVLIETMKDRVGISVDGHGSRVVALVGHDDCAGNPVDKATQLEQMDIALELVKSWGFDAKIIGVYINDNIDVELVRE